jgi:amidase
MGGFREYDHYDALGLAELVRTRQVTPAELCEAAIGRIEALNPRFNAVVTPMFDLGRAAAVGPLPEGPFTGVPFLIKDLHYTYAGVPISSGCRALRHFVPDHDDEMVARIKRAGAIILGKTNTPEFGLMAITEPELFGPCRNPWDLERTPGGSSGGAAAAVAAGMVPMAAGGDGGGSIRIPAAYCGLFGLKPSRAATPPVRTTATSGRGRSRTTSSPAACGTAPPCWTPPRAQMWGPPTRSGRRKPPSWSRPVPIRRH